MNSSVGLCNIITVENLKPENFCSDENFHVDTLSTFVFVQTLGCCPAVVYVGKSGLRWVTGFWLTAKFATTAFSVPNR